MTRILLTSFDKLGPEFIPALPALDPHHRHPFGGL